MVIKKSTPNKNLCGPPFLRRIWVDYSKIEDFANYPFSLSLFRNRNFEIRFEKSVTILVGENGSGKSTILGGIAGLAGYNESGGGKGYGPLNKSPSIKVSGGNLSGVLRAGWWPKVTEGWFFRAESFFSLAHYLDQAARDVNALPPNFLANSHGEGFLRFFKERMGRRGIFILDEPDSALSFNGQLDFLKMIVNFQKENLSQIIISTHSPIIMACPNAQIIDISDNRINYVTLETLHQFDMMRDFYNNPSNFIRRKIEQCSSSMD